MADIDLIFSRAPVATPGPVELLFGQQDDPVWEVEATLSGALTGLSLAAVVAHVADAIHEATVSGALTGLSLTAEATFSSNVERPLCAQSALRHQVAGPAKGAATPRHQNAEPRQSTTAAAHQIADRLHAGVDVAHEDAIRLRAATAGAHQKGVSAPAAFGASHQDGLRDRRLSRAPRHQQGALLRAAAGGRHQDTYRDRRLTFEARAQQAHRVSQQFCSEVGVGQALVVQFVPVHQQAWVPRPGRWTPTVEPPQPPNDPCYLPDPNLLFGAAPGGPGLVFLCERHGTPATLVIPVRSLYMVTNNITLTRVSDGAPVPANAASVTLDADSWTWGFTASLPGAARALVEDGTELLLVVNGMSFRVLVDENERDRSFGRSDLTIRGRGRNALLDDEAAVRSYTNAVGMTALQLAEEALTLNGIPLGWSVDWGLTDWFVPAGAWSAQGTPVNAVLQIAAAAGGYVQPHFTDTSLLVLPRYPALPRDWSGLTPDVELPSSVVQVEGIRWQRRPEYNRIYVAGGDVGGVMGQVTIAGTAGDLAAQMVVDPLITHVDAARQRGLSVLGASGRKAHVRLKVPGLPELGFVRPGRLVRYVDGATTRLGLVRSAQLDATFGSVWQTLGIETHVV